MSKDNMTSKSNESFTDDEAINCCQLKVHQKRILRNRAKHKMESEYEKRLKHRSCTDVFCLFIFVVAIVAWAVVGWLAFQDASPGKILAPVDSQMRKCGYDKGVEDKPVLFFFDITQCFFSVDKILSCKTDQVCIEKCPSENFYASYYLSESTLTPQEIAKKLICKDDTVVASIQTKEDIAREIFTTRNCVAYYFSSINAGSRCLPDITKLIGDDGGNLQVEINGKNVTIPGVDVSQILEKTYLLDAYLSVREFWESVAKDLVETWPILVGCVCGAALLSFIYIQLMRWMAGIMVWASIFACIVALAFGGYTTFMKYNELRKIDANITQSNLSLRRNLLDDIGSSLNEQLDAIARNKTTWLVLFGICIATLLIILLILLFLRTRIRLAVALIREGSKAVGHSWTTLVFPIFPWILQFAILFYGISIFLFLLTSGVSLYKVQEVKNATNCFCENPKIKYGALCFPKEFDGTCQSETVGTCLLATCEKTQAYTIYMQLYNLFALLWTVFFISGVGQIMLASTFATYYWTSNKKDLPVFIVAESAWRVIRYHLGTAALGSFLIALVTWLRILIELAFKYCDRYKDYTIVKAVKCCLSCFFWCLEKFLKFISKNAYIMCAIHGKAFCTSASDAFSLIVRNALRVFVLDNVARFLFFISKLVIAAAMGAASFYIFAKPVPKITNLGGGTYEVTYYFVPMFIVIVAAYFIASIFFSVYGMAVDTLFLCFLEDSEKNDGSLQRPYYMSKNLMSILGRRNKLG